MRNSAGLILEIFSQKTRLKMCLFEKSEFSPAIKTYSESPFKVNLIDKLCQEITSILNKQDKKFHIGKESLRELRKAGQLLYDQLLSRVVKEKLKNTSYVDLILSVDEKLVSIPWELLYDGDNFLCLKFNLGRSIRTEREMITQNFREFSDPLKMLIIANPTGDLTSSYEEGLQIKNYLIKNEVVNVDFKSYDIDSIFVKKNLRDYDLVHFAGHCEHDAAGSSKSGWVLRDGLMSSEDFLIMAQT